MKIHRALNTVIPLKVFIPLGFEVSYPYYYMDMTPVNNYVKINNAVKSFVCLNYSNIYLKPVLEYIV